MSIDRTTIDAEEPGDGTLPPEPGRSSGRYLVTGTRIGPYVIRQPLGEGGFGVVYDADQTSPVRRRVAIKIVRAGLDSEQVLARFEAERRALALMDHSGIARILDAGLSEQGRPFFAMELVKGLPIVAHCDRHRLGIHARVALIADVCRAVQHAHAKGIVHRDLKPANILVEHEDGRSLPKVIDFGVAKALDRPLGDASHFTQHGQIVGTPEYMSPEQAEMDVTDIDTRSDIYSLGVILYELLTGSRPFEMDSSRRRTPAELRLAIRDQEAPRPSTRLRSLGGTAQGSGELSRIAEARDTDARTLRGALSRDLDWVVMRCLEKDRERRYASASELAADLDRFLRHEPVLAGPPTASYRLSKFYRRHRPTVIIGSGAFVALLASTATITVLAIEASDLARREGEQRRIATTRAAELEAVADFQAERLASLDVTAMGFDLRRGLIDGAGDAARRRGLDDAEVTDVVQRVTVDLEDLDFAGLATDSVRRHVVGDAVETIEREFADQPLVQATLFESLRSLHQAIGATDDAVAVGRRALDLRRRHQGESAVETLASLADQSMPLLDAGFVAEAEEAAATAVAGLRAADAEGATLAHALNLQNSMLMAAGDWTGAEAAARESLTLIESRAAGSVLDRIEVLAGLALALSRQQRFEEARSYFEQALDRARSALGPDDPTTIMAISNLAGLHVDEGDLETAERLYLESMEAFERVLGRNHPDAISACSNYAYILLNLERHEDAESWSRDALARRTALLGPMHPDTLGSRHQLGYVLEKTGDLDEAIASQREVIAGFRRIYGADHPDTFTVVDRLGRLLDAADRHEEALEPYRTVAEGRLRVEGEDNRGAIASLSNFSGILVENGRIEEATEVGDRAVRLARAAFEPDDWYLGMVLLQQARVLQSVGRPVLAMETLEEADRLIAAHFPEGHAYRARSAERRASIAADLDPEAATGGTATAVVEDGEDTP